ncbi:MAG: Maltooligosyl trehalose synthase [Chlamydiae bacterium]|nr:Maltooligosyl trehalose synthase [Chlamydiota bacterium]
MKKAPSSIYRLQLNEDFPLKEATELLPYLKKLGVDGVYCSPYFAAYSPHGYDIIDPNRINPLIATQKDFAAFCKKLKKLKMLHIADIVPNHMGIQGENLWWQDVLAKGEKSKYASYFDIDWSKKKLLVPLLGEPYDEALRTKKLTIVRKEKKLWAKYNDLFFPVNGKLLPKTPRAIDALLQKQHYQLVDWLMAAQETSYRRFFNIGDLIGVRIEDKKVLRAHHKWIFQLLKKKKIDGLRVDHPDGLYDPQEYFDRLRKKTKGLIVVEKILGWKEELPSNWKVDGTVGYEFLNMLTGVFIKKNERLNQTYARFIGRKDDIAEMVYEKKKFYMATEMAGDVKALADKLFAFSSKMRAFADLPKGDILKALYELLAAFPVYRSYIRPTGEMPEQDKPYWKETFQIARSRNRELGYRVFDFLESVFFLKLESPILRDFILCFQQLSAPIMAKGFEDITLYNYNRLLACNEVGSEPERGGITTEEFHAFCKRKREKWPLGFLATSTHDTKRSMDVRMQLAVLSEIPAKWEKKLKYWSKCNLKHKTAVGHLLFPEKNAEYFLYQILLGVWPSKPTFKRLWISFQKSIREARAFTSWRHPDLKYEKACENFLKAILKKGTPFRRSFEAFHKEIQEYGEWKSLAATAIQIGCPGIVDVYQGCENWRYTLVDPDNRSLVDYSKPETLKTELTRTALHFRRTHKALFLEGDYIPLKVHGPKQDYILAYLRTYRKKALLVAGVRFFADVKSLKGTEILLPKNLGRGEGIFSHATFEGKILPAMQLFSEAPFAWIFWA